ncbi:MAG TPA: hypothetical protein VH540_25670 [Ktedonobacterales bacterium]
MVRRLALVECQRKRAIEQERRSAGFAPGDAMLVIAPDLRAAAVADTRQMQPGVLVCIPGISPASSASASL